MVNFKIKVSNEKELYDFLQDNEDIDFEEKECKSLEWTLKANISMDEYEGFGIRTSIKKKKNQYLQKTELINQLKNYNIDSQNKVISFNETNYYCAIVSKEKEYVITIDCFSESLNNFKEMLSLNNELLEKLVNAYCKRNNLEIPEFEYLLNTSKMNDENPYYKDFEEEIEIKNFEINFEDIGGNYEGKKEMNRIYQDIIYPQIAMLFGRDPNKEKGYLLYGGKGNGKTMLVKALATKLSNELKNKIKLYQISYGNVSSIFRGGESGKIKDLFELVKINEKKGLATLIFMDELQSIAVRKYDYNEVLDELLTNIGGLYNYKNLIFIGATYAPLEQIDEALIRPGRLGKHIEIKMPSADERKEIMQIYLKKSVDFVKNKTGFENLFSTIDLGLLSKETEGYNGSDIMMLFESVRHKKEEETLSKFSKIDNTEEIKKSITPINTSDFLKEIRKKLNKNELSLYN
ncbi:MAG: ATP-binding protein [Candidatus Nanoarchaeia archaeon]|jgi:SpoVK/Ycf46/Vps4 family AAA+-type ATPase